MAIALVGSNTDYWADGNGTTSSIALAFPSDVRNGSLLCCGGMTDYSNAGTTASVWSSSKGDVFTHAATPSFPAVNISYVTDAVGGATTITFTVGVADWLNIAIAEFDGHHQVPADGTATATGYSDACDPGDITTTAAGLLFSCNTMGDATTITTPTNFTNIGEDEIYGAAGGSADYRITTSSGTYNALYAQTVTGDWRAAMAAFKEGKVRPNIIAKSGSTYVTSVTSDTATITVPSGYSDGCFFVCVQWLDSATVTVSSVATNVTNGIDGSGTALTAVPSSRVENLDSAVYVGAQWWYGKNPSTGAHTITATFGAGNDDSLVEVFYLDNVNQSTPYSGVQTSTDNSQTPNTETLTFTTGDYTKILCSGHENDVGQTLTVTDGQTQLEQANGNYWGVSAAIASKFRSGATTNVGFGLDGDNAVFTGLVVEPVVTLAREQSAYRFWEDDAAYASATALANQDTAANFTEDTNAIVALQVQALGDPATKQYKLQFRRQGDADSEWEDIAT